MNQIPTSTAEEVIPLKSESNITPSSLPAPQFKPIYVLIIVVFLILFGAGGLLLGKSLYAPKTPAVIPVPTQVPSLTPDETTNWKTYTNTKYGLTFRYPTSLTLTENATTGETKLIFQLKEEGINIIFSIVQMDIKPPYDWVIEHGPSGKLGISFPNVEDVKKSSRNDYATVEFIDYAPGWQPGDNTRYYYVAFNSGDLVYLFGLQPPATENGKKVFDQILSTFKFD